MRKPVVYTTSMSKFRLLDQQRLKKLKQGVWADDKKTRERAAAQEKKDNK